MRADTHGGTCGGPSYEYHSRFREAGGASRRAAPEAGPGPGARQARAESQRPRVASVNQFAFSARLGLVTVSDIVSDGRHGARITVNE